MTLLCCSEIEYNNNKHILLASDSVLSFGCRWKFGPKIFPIYRRGDCAIAFEGGAFLAYSFLIHSLNTIQHSRSLFDSNLTDAGSFCMNFRNHISKLYSEFINDDEAKGCFDIKQDGCSFIFIGWARIDQPILYRVSPPDNGENWKLENFYPDASIKVPNELSFNDHNWKNYKVFFTGNGDHDPVTKAWNHLEEDDSQDYLAAYRALLSVIDDETETGVGGVPQIVVASPGGIRVFGIAQEGRKSYLGQRVYEGTPETIVFLKRDLSNIWEFLE